MKKKRNRRCEEEAIGSGGENKEYTMRERESVNEETEEGKKIGEGEADKWRNKEITSERSALFFFFFLCFSFPFHLFPSFSSFFLVFLLPSFSYPSFPPPLCLFLLPPPPLSFSLPLFIPLLLLSLASLPSSTRCPFPFLLFSSHSSPPSLSSLFLPLPPTPSISFPPPFLPSFRLLPLRLLSVSLLSLNLPASLFFSSPSPFFSFSLSIPFLPLAFTSHSSSSLSHLSVSLLLSHSFSLSSFPPSLPYP